MQDLYKLILIGLIVSLGSCTTVRLAVYDFQKKQAYKTENNLKEEKTETASASLSKEHLAKKAITEKAEKYIGTRYRYGSCDASKGFDCSGLVYHVAKSQEVILPRSSQSMASIGPHIPWKKAQEGDLIFFGDKGGIHHVGIVDKNKGDELWIIHSTNSLGVVREDILVSDYWRSRVLFAIDIFSSKENIKT